ncbi:MAG TPA: FUSC family protein [Candidatus Acidoferrum sp.]|nr:FUSC family protein [Candidatus Acidoferrum sp.]
MASSVSQTAPAHEGAARAFWSTLTRFDSSKLAPHMALRNSLGVLLPLVAGFALNMPRGGLVVASGALNVAYSDRSDAYAQRAKRMLASSVLCALGVLLGALSGSHNVAAVIIATLWAFAAGMFVAAGTTAADLGVISLVTLMIYAAQPLTSQQALISSGLALGGGLLQTALSVALWPVQRYEPERRALATLFLELAGAAEQPLSATSPPPATIQSTQAQEALSGLDSETGVEALRYRALLSQAERIRLTLLILSRLHLRMQRERAKYAGVQILADYLKRVGQALEAIGGSLGSGAPPAANKEIRSSSETYTLLLRQETENLPLSFLAAVAKDARFQMDALNGQLRAALDLAANAAPAGQIEFARQQAQQPWWLRFSGVLATLRANLNLQSSAFRHAIRLAAMVALGNSLERAFYWRRSYWLPMTIVLVLKPEFTTTFTRGVLRIAGTIVGLFLATALFHLVPGTITLQIILIFLFTLLLRWFGPANYGIFAVAISALVVFLIALTGVSPKEVIWARGMNTAAGGAMALLAYWIWPTWERTQVSERVAEMLDAYRAYFHRLWETYARNEAAGATELDRVRLEARLARTNLEASIERLRTEPGTTAEQVNELNALLASSHRLVHSLMALDAGWLHTAAVAPRPTFHAFAEHVVKTLDLLTAALRGKRVKLNEFPDLREDHHVLVQSGDQTVERYALVNVEADRIVNSLNTLREQVMERMRRKNAA